jgi:15-cis-phytoene synthase
MTAAPRALEEPYRGRAVPPGSPRFCSWLFAAPEARDALLGIYALMAEWRALTVPSAEATAAQLKLAWWQEEIGRLVRRVPLHPISRYLASLPRADRVDFRPLSAAVEAAARQLAGAPLEHGADLEAHAAALGAAPLSVAAELAREQSAQSQHAVHRSAAALAAAQYLKDSLGDYRREARCGRVILPIDELLAARIENADLTAEEVPDHLQSYLAGLRERALRFFAAASEALPRAERASSRHLLVLAALGARHVRGREMHRGNFRLRDLYLAWSTARRAARQS